MSHTPGKLRKFERLSKSQRNLFTFCGKPGKFMENVKCDMIVNENVFQQTFLSREREIVFLREKFENTLEILGKAHGI